MSNSTQKLIYQNEELKALLRESEQFAAQLEIERDSLRDAMMSIEEVCSGTSDEAMKIQEIIDNAIR